MYTPEHYQKYKHLFAKGRKKWYEKRKEELRAKGLNINGNPIKTVEEKKIHAKERQKRYYEENGERFRKYFRDLYHSDPKFREKKANYLREWRAKKKLENGK